jgi:hypothetical protein
VSWSLRFGKPILLADGGKVASLRKAIAHLVKIIPAPERGSPAVLTAAELLANAAEHGGPMSSPESRPCRLSIATSFASSIPIAKSRIEDGGTLKWDLS